jgi:murein DD-endopeptidase MepM/ murein hydrolase activator NlpD
VTTYHEGIDLGGITGEPVHAAAAGVVVLAETLQVRGNAVILDHGAGVLSGYYHLDRIAVQAGQRVGQGDLLGAMGATGLVTGSHLHWELRVGGVAVDPREWTEWIFP